MRSSAGGEVPHGNGGRGGAALDADGMEFLLEPGYRFPLREEFADSLELEQPNPDTLGFLRPSMALGCIAADAVATAPSPSTPRPPLLSRSQSHRRSSLPCSPVLDSCSPVSTFSCTDRRHLVLLYWLAASRSPVLVVCTRSLVWQPPPDTTGMCYASADSFGGIVVCELEIRSCEAPSILLWSIATTPAMPAICNMVDVVVTDAAELPRCPSAFQHVACCAGVRWWW
ncbi:uncharacterized protein [Triticum aestivum]|uniref:uncharacterized protein n=1 Tax=Triticum aestivum TaxID=4565 RepID=UPI001D0293D0|nr:uncharacterized protein LOC123126140 [Triticum aestivum]